MYNQEKSNNLLGKHGTAFKTRKALFTGTVGRPRKEYRLIKKIAGESSDEDREDQTEADDNQDSEEEINDKCS